MKIPALTKDELEALTVYTELTRSNLVDENTGSPRRMCFRVLRDMETLHVGPRGGQRKGLEMKQGATLILNNVFWYDYCSHHGVHRIEHNDETVTLVSDDEAKLEWYAHGVLKPYEAQT